MGQVTALARWRKRQMCCMRPLLAAHVGRGGYEAAARKPSGNRGPLKHTPMAPLSDSLGSSQQQWQRQTAEAARWWTRTEEAGR